MPEEELRSHRGRLRFAGYLVDRSSERILLGGMRHEQRRLGAAIVEQPSSRWIEPVRARDAQHVGVRRYGISDRIVEEREARIVVVGQDGTSDLGAPRLRAMVHGGKVTARRGKAAEMRQSCLKRRPVI